MDPGDSSRWVGVSASVTAELFMVYIRSNMLETIVAHSERIKPLSFLKANATDIIANFDTDPQPIIITQNGEARMVVMGIERYESERQTAALLKLIALGRREFKDGKFQDADSFFDEMAGD